MTKHSIGACIVVMLAALIGASAPAAASVRFIVSPNVHVSNTEPGRWHYEPYVGADPNDPQRLIACSAVGAPYPYQTSTVISSYVSDDGGATWHPSISLGGRAEPSPEEPGAPDDPGDTVCGFTDYSEYYFAALRFWPLVAHGAYRLLVGKGPGLAQDMGDLAFFTSSDAKSWTVARLPEGDREFVILDQRPRSAAPADEQHVIYIPIMAAYGLFQRLSGGDSPTGETTVYRSSDGGKTFAAYAIYVSLKPPYYMEGFVGQGGMFADGTFFVPMMVFPIFNQKLRTKPYGNLEAITPHAPYYFMQPAPVRISPVAQCDGNNSTWYVPNGTVDSSSSRYRGRAYITWSDYQRGYCATFLAWSADQGHTWSKPVAVSDYHGGARPDHMGPDEGDPVVAVNRDGVVGVSWYDRRSYADDVDADVRFAVSTDGGRSFSRSVVVSSGRLDYNQSRMNLHSEYAQSAPGRLEFSIGDQTKAIPGETSGLTASADGSFHPLWIDNRTGANQVWTTTVRAMTGGDVRSPDVLPVRHPWPSYKPAFAAPETTACAGSGPRRKPWGLAIAVTDAWIDNATGLITGNAFVINNSTSPLRFPIDVEATSLKTTMGKSVAVDAKGHKVAHPCWRFVGNGNAAMLAFNDTSAPARMRFKIDRVKRRTYKNLQDVYQYVAIKARVTSSR